jgi:hypothetical protein
MMRFGFWLCFKVLFLCAVKILKFKIQDGDIK